MTGPNASGPARARGRPTGLRFDERADVPMRIAPLLLVGLILVVLALVGDALL